jgi:hypothetical protein
VRHDVRSCKVVHFVLEWHVLIGVIVVDEHERWLTVDQVGIDRALRRL